MTRAVKKKLKAIAENMPLVYEAGMAEGGDTETAYNEGYSAGYDVGFEEGKAVSSDSWYDTFWDTYQNSGKRTDYYQAFATVGWTETTLKPKYDIHPVSAGYMFRYCPFSGDMVKHFENLGRKFSFENISGSPAQVFRDMPNVTRLFAIDVSKINSLNYWYHGDSKLETIDLIKLNDSGSPSTSFTDTFVNCQALQNITFEGTISKSISFVDSPLLSKDSIHNIIDHLKDYDTEGVTPPSTKPSITFHKYIILNSTEQAEIYLKGWDLVQ